MSASTGNRTLTRGSLAFDQIHYMDALSGLALLESDSIDCIVTSPPYWGTRDYGVEPIQWPDGSIASLGLETHPDLFVEHLCRIFDAARRVLKPTGTLWVNLGDCYCHRERMQAIEARQPKGDEGSGPHRHPFPVPEKSLCLVPERFVLAMSKRGWILRNRIIWRKRNHLPSNVKDRFTSSHEDVFFFVKSGRYSFNLDSVRVPHKTPLPTPRPTPERKRVSPSILHSAGLPGRYDRHAFHPLGGNPSDCWEISTAPGLHGHPAPFPEALCERPILAGCPVGGVVLDPFMGSGTTAIVAQRLGRHFIGFELNPAYVTMARNRLVKAREQLKQARTHVQTKSASEPLKGGALEAA